MTNSTVSDASSTSDKMCPFQQRHPHVSIATGI